MQIHGDRGSRQIRVASSSYVTSFPFRFLHRARARARATTRKATCFFPSLFSVILCGQRSWLRGALIVRKIAVTAVSRRNLSRVTTVLTDVRRDILSRSSIVRTIAAAVRHGFSRNLLYN